ncbi:BadF/BadG/BcrA/BcrD ATPase family protein [Priestia megaterium]|uniref:BadF/BadG/BcrA/BcrD ATPase family protein n=1 Tax=Priestia megaterium TaxID=1404 RepID=UPI00204067EA|nr:BadF/BadG/BcrA/BcrD ATPase family protein [Priestia megaterium]MCM3545039.1 ATPase [Priestia megaterium]
MNCSHGTNLLFVSGDKMDYIIGIDGGGTKTEGVAYSLDGQKLAASKSGYGNLLINYNTAITHIGECITACKTALAGHTCKGISLGLAGSKALSKEEIKRYFYDRYQVDVGLYDDAMIAHEALLHGKDGILTIAGTGAVSIGKKDGVYEYGGGWGHLLGDEGSGYWIGLQALILLTKEHDQSRTYSSLSQTILQHVKADTIHDIKKFVYSSPKSEVASLTPLVVNQARNHKQEASDILQQAGKNLANMTLHLYTKQRFEGSCLLACKGSILTEVPEVFDVYKKTCEKEIKHIQWATQRVSSAKGAYQLFMKEYK